MCGGFKCSKTALILLNVLYLVVAIIMISVGAYAKGSNRITSLKIAGGIIAAGVFLLLISLVGILGALKHHQVTLFFYMIILFMIFLIQFFVAIACLAMNENQRHNLLYEGWKRADNSTRNDAERAFGCCRFMAPPGMKPPSASECAYEEECSKKKSQCDTCDRAIDRVVAQSLRAAGGVSLFFSFTEIAGVWLSLRYRNQKDPTANPNQFL